MTSGKSDLEEQLTEARQTIQRHESEIERLRSSQGDAGLASEIRDLLVSTAATGVMVSSSTHRDALYHVVETAASVLEAKAGALFLVDEASGELIFEVAIGGKAEEVKQFRLPMGHGFAGWCAATGQPIAVADAEQDQRFAREIAEAVYYVPKTVLCVPFVLDYRVLGVLELLDKAGGAPFTTRDMEILGLFASLAARTIDESRLIHDMRRLFRELMEDLVREGTLSEPAALFADRAAEYADNADAIRLAGLVHQLCLQGEGARRLAIEVLTSVNRYFAYSSPI